MTGFWWPPPGPRLSARVRQFLDDGEPRAGTPAVTVPFTADQPFGGRRTAAVGAGPPPVPLKNLTPQRLAEAIDAAGGCRAGAVAVSRDLAREDGIGTAVRLIRQ